MPFAHLPQPVAGGGGAGAGAGAAAAAADAQQSAPQSAPSIDVIRADRDAGSDVCSLSRQSPR